MQFSPADMAAILAATGEDVTVTLSGVTVDTIRGKFRTDYQAVELYGDGVGSYSPAFLCDPAELAPYTGGGYVFTARGIDYVIIGEPQLLNSGFARVILEKA
jgi:hypothetical protein